MKFIKSIILTILFSTSAFASNDTLPDNNIDFKKACIENALGIAEINHGINSYLRLHTAGIMLSIGGSIIGAAAVISSNSSYRNLSFIGFGIAAIGSLLLTFAPYSLRKRNKSVPRINYKK
jgi:ABC-type uncharacterized transport system permease subunit